MKKYLILIFALTLFSCSQNTQNLDNSEVKNAEFVQDCEDTWDELTQCSL